MRAALLLLLSLVAGPPGPDPAPSEDRIRTLVRDLGAESWETRDGAYRELQALGEKAHPILREALDGDDIEVRRAATRLLRDAESSADRGWRRRLRDRSPNFTESDAFRELVGLGPEGVPLLIEVIREETRSASQYDYTTLRNAYAVLRKLVEDGQIGPDRLELFIDLLDSPNSQTRHLGRPILRTLAGQELAGVLRREYRRPSASPHLRANLLHLMDMEQASEATSLLSEALGDEAPALRIAAAQLMWRRAREEHLPLLLDAAADPVVEVRSAIVRALQRYPDNREARAAIGVALGDPDDSVQRAAVEAAATITERTTDRSLVPSVRKLLSSSDPVVVQSAANLVARIRDRDATPLLIPLLEHENPEFRQRVLTTVVLALGRIADPAARDSLERFLRDPETLESPILRSARIYAVQALLRIAGEDALPHAEALLIEDSESAPQILMQTLAEIPGRRRIPLLLAGLEHPNRFVVAHAAIGLGRAGAAEAAPKLLERLETEDRYLRQSLLQALGAIGSPASGPGLLAFVEAALDERDDARTTDVHHVRLAIEALGASGYRPAEKTLVRILRRRNRFLAPTAEALSRLGADDARRALLDVSEGLGDSTTGRNVAAALARLGDISLVKALHERDLAAIDDENPAVLALARAADSAIRIGRVPDAIRLAKRRIAVDPAKGAAHYDLACVLALAGKPDLALETLERARTLGYRNAHHLLVDPDLESLRELQAFRDLASRMSRP